KPTALPTELTTREEEGAHTTESKINYKSFVHGAHYSTAFFIVYKKINVPYAIALQELRFDHFATMIDLSHHLTETRTVDQTTLPVVVDRLAAGREEVTHVRRPGLERTQLCPEAADVRKIELELVAEIGSTVGRHPVQGREAHEIIRVKTVATAAMAD